MWKSEAAFVIMEAHSNYGMKKLRIYLLLTALSFYSCSEKVKFDSLQHSQKWQLQKMTGMMPNSEKTGADMDWQEIYIFNADHTFVKSRDKNGIIVTATGVFELKNLPPDGDFFELTFTTNSDIIGSCYDKPYELLWLKSKDRLVSTWQNCDGPGLEYSRIF